MSHKRYEAHLVHMKPGFNLENEKTILIDLASVGLCNQVEELWCEDLGGGRVRVASIPFCLYGVSLFDVLAVPEEFEVRGVSVVENSGRGVVRIMVDPALEDHMVESISLGISESLISNSFAHEWNGRGFVSIDVPDVDFSDRLLEVIDSLESVYWEWGVECRNS
ncbi:DUF4265 domain-containing protein [Nocardiopsis sp. LOL_012]|uniref:DUF4265 domain-containing protein n=1 Tax=Nocardiopsis sp. LOL_012 TaxID=3345409 RepID=UPI003A8722A4